MDMISFCHVIFGTAVFDDYGISFSVLCLIGLSRLFSNIFGMRKLK